MGLALRWGIKPQIAGIGLYDAMPVRFGNDQVFGADVGAADGEWPSSRTISGMRATARACNCVYRLLPCASIATVAGPNCSTSSVSKRNGAMYSGQFIATTRRSERDSRCAPPPRNDR